MIERYEQTDVAAVWGDVFRYSEWLRLELQCMSEYARLGRGSPQSAAEAWMLYNQTYQPESPGLALFINRCRDREEIVHHDVAAFVDEGERRFGRDFHYGLTSSDIVDTVLFKQLAITTRIVMRASDELREALVAQELLLQGVGCVARTHGQWAEASSVNHALQNWGDYFRRNRNHLDLMQREVEIGKLRGPVGLQDPFLNAVEWNVLKQRGVRPVAGEVTQVLPRDTIARWVYEMAELGAALENLGTQIRLLAQTEVGEVAEGRSAETKGSSSMPRKRNPIRSEQLCGVGRMLRAWVGPALENVSLWGYRDISHSSVERVMLPDVAHLAVYGLRSATSLVQGLEWNTELMINRCESGAGAGSLDELVRQGVGRDEAYRRVQRADEWDPQWGEDGH